MRIIYDAVIAFFAASGIYAVARMLSAVLFKPRRRKAPYASSKRDDFKGGQTLDRAP